MSDEKATLHPIPGLDLNLRHEPGRDFWCENLRDHLNRYLAERCSGKANAMKPGAENPRCPCGDPAESGVDLVVLVDASGSMSGAWAALGQAAEAAIKNAEEVCGVKPRVEWLGVDASDTGTQSSQLPAPFNQSHEEYLRQQGAQPPFAADGDGIEDNEQGGKAIIDLARHFDWRPGACRSIFYASDEMLDSDSKTPADSRKAADAAIAAANAAGVRVFTHHVGTRRGQSVASQHPQIAQHYRDLAEKTGGAAHIGDEPSAELYNDLLTQAICRACGEPGCVEAELPELVPCIDVTWGDSECDCIESDDQETLCVTVCNCYSNVTFANLEIQVAVVTDEDGSAVASLPDGTPSVQVLPVGPLCFGDVGPCVDGEATCVSRQLVLTNRGAKAGSYKVQLYGICFDLVHRYSVPGARFDFEICKD